jgi:hypothetical protein
MAVFYSSETSGLGALPVVKPTSAGYGANLKRFRATITLPNPAITTADTIVLAQVPAGFTFAFGVLNASVSLGTSTISIGVAGATAKYRALAASTLVDTPTLFGPAVQAGNQTPLPADETIFMTIATANLPTTGTVVVDLFFSRP